MNQASEGWKEPCGTLIPERLVSRLLPNLSQLAPLLRRRRAAILTGYACVLATNGFSLAIPWVLGRGVDHLEAGRRTEMLRDAATILLLSAASGVFLYLMRRILIGASRRIEYELRARFHRHIQSLSLSFFQKQQTGDLMARAGNDIGAVRDCIGPGIMYGMNTVTTVVASLILMTRLDPWLTLYTVIPLPLLAFAVRHFSSQMHRRSRAVQDHYGHISAFLQENISGIRVVQAYAQRRNEEDHFDGLNRAYMGLGFRLIRTRSLFIATMGSLVGILMLVLLWLGGLRVIEGGIGLGTFTAFLGYLGMLTWPFIALGWVISMVQRGEAAFARILEIEGRTPEIRSPDEPIRSPSLRGGISFSGIRFRYGDESPEVLRGIDAKIEPGATVAIVGRTGSGKSTLLSLVPRLHDPTSGAVELDGVDARRRDLEEIRTAIAVVPQESFLFSETLRANLLMGDPEAGETEIAEAVRMARLDGDLAGFPAGLETVVGERGVTLSGGQRQRVAIARALLARPSILILDDALSSVDKITESELLASLRAFREGRTTLIVAHRISTVRDADRILVLEDGMIAEEGTHEDLLALDGIYAAMARRQRLSEEIEDAVAS